VQSNSIAARAGRWSAQHRRKAILAWVAFVVIALVSGGMIGTNQLSDDDAGTGQSAHADKTLNAAFPKETVEENVFVQSRGGTTADDPAFRAAVDAAVAKVKTLPGVTEVSSPFEKGNEGQVSKDRKSALVSYELPEREGGAADKQVEQIEAAVASVAKSNPSLRVEAFGDATLDKGVSDRFDKDFQRAEVLSLPVTLVILVVAFGALVAAGLPLLLGLSAVAAAIGLLALPSQIIPVEEAIFSVILLVGMAVGVDYSMFYLRREREERAAGKSPQDAIAIAAATSGRAVLVSGLTVMIAMAGMFLTGDKTFMGFGLGTIIVVAAAMLGSLTVIPAMLSWLGDRVDKGKVPLLWRLKSADGESRMWNAILRVSLRRPLVSAVAATALLLALAAPTLGLHTALSGTDSMPRDIPIMKTYDRIEAAFPGQPAPAIVAVHASDVTSPRVAGAIADMQREAQATGLLHGPMSVTVSADRSVARVQMSVAGDGTDATSNRALAALRDDVIPATVGHVPGVSAPVTGWTAGSKDFNDQMKSSAPIVFAFVLSLAFLLLLVTFRSIVIPIKAIVLNLLSVGAAYGVLVWGFQDGHLESVLGFESTGAIVSWLPLFLFVILFGLSMDYHVFILSRIREAYDRGMSTEAAISHGLRTTAGVVTSAAVVMVGVFSIFGTLSMVDFKQMGVGLAVAVLLDATIVRGVLLPAVMKLLGDRNWYLPRWLEWLPQVGGHEPAERHRDDGALPEGARA
jgi:RND superfamily putative drug exporter